MNSDRFSEREIEALRAFYAELSPGSGEDQNIPPQAPPAYVAFQRLLAAAKAPRDQDNIDDVHECFGGPKLEPVLPLRPPEPVDRWDLISRVLQERDFQFVERKMGTLAAWRFRRNQVRVHSMYTTSICVSLRREHAQIVEASRVAEKWDIQYLKQRAVRRELGILRLRFAGVVYLTNVHLGERLSMAAIEAMRTEFSLAPSAA